MHQLNVLSLKISLFNPLVEYYIFNLYHMQHAFYRLLMGWCLSPLCFVLELFYNCVLRRKN